MVLFFLLVFIFFLSPPYFINLIVPGVERQAGIVWVFDNIADSCLQIPVIFDTLMTDLYVLQCLPS